VAQRRGLIVEVSDERLCSMFVMPCHFCGQEASKCLNGIDRLDSNRGYIEGNIVPCCGDCNFAKRSLTVEDFLQLIKRIAIRQGWIGE
jgi:Zn-finger protein